MWNHKVAHRIGKKKQRIEKKVELSAKWDGPERPYNHEKKKTVNINKYGVTKFQCLFKKTLSYKLYG